MKNNELKIIFFGTPEFSAVILKSLIDQGYNIAAVFTQPDKKIGRRHEVSFSPVKILAAEKGIKIFQPNDLRNANLAQEIKNIQADILVVAAYGKILPKEILDIPKFGAINVHASLLPKYRGASPVQSTILSGEKETGITLIKMNEKMDEGDILMQEKIEIGEKETADELLIKLSQVGAKMIMRAIPEWILGNIQPLAQDHDKATYCKPIRREDGKIDWNRSAEEIFRMWQAYYPWPGAYTTINLKNQTKRLKLLEIDAIFEKETGEKCGKIIKYNQKVAVQAKKGLIVLKKIQLEGKKKVDIKEFSRGNPEFVGSILE